MRDIADDDFKSVAYNPRKRTNEENAMRKARGEPELPYEAHEAYLHALWKDQEGCCNICGIGMDLIGESHVTRHSNMFRVSVDCIDPAKWYAKGNVALVHFVCNSFKNRLDVHTLYAVASGIVKRFENMYPELKVEIAKELVSRDGVKCYPYPKYTYKSDGKGVLFDAGREFFSALIAASAKPPEELQDPAPPDHPNVE